MAKKYWVYKGKKLPVKKYYPETKKTSEQLYNELIRKVGQANKRLRAIKKEFDTLGWAGESLKEKTSFHLVNTWRSRGIKINKDMSKEQMKATLKAINVFLGSKTSTVKGIKETMKKQQISLRKSLLNEDIDLSPEESKVLYKRFLDKDYQILASYLGASELNALIEDSKEHNDSLEDFIDNADNYIIFDKFNDDDLRNALEEMYYKYVRS